MKKITLRLFGLLLLININSAHAGEYSDLSLRINDNAGGPEGRLSLNATRDQPYGSTSSGGCTVHLVVETNTKFIFCQAYRHQNSQLTCYLANPTNLQLYPVLGLNKVSDLGFQVNDSGRCVAINVSNNSKFLNR